MGLQCSVPTELKLYTSSFIPNAPAGKLYIQLQIKHHNIYQYL